MKDEMSLEEFNQMRDEHYAEEDKITYAINLYTCQKCGRAGGLPRANGAASITCRVCEHTLSGSDELMEIWEYEGFDEPDQTPDGVTGSAGPDDSALDERVKELAPLFNPDSDFYASGADMPGLQP